MTEMLVWLLINVPTGLHFNSAQPAVTVARFARVEECERVRKVLTDAGNGKLMCIQARVLP